MRRHSGTIRFLMGYTELIHLGVRGIAVPARRPATQGEIRINVRMAKLILTI